MLNKYVREYEAVRQFIVAEYKQKMRKEREVFDDEEFKMVDGNYNHPYYLTIKAMGEERDQKLADLKTEFEAKT